MTIQEPITGYRFLSVLIVAVVLFMWSMHLGRHLLTVLVAVALTCFRYIATAHFNFIPPDLGCKGLRD